MTGIRSLARIGAGDGLALLRRGLLRQKDNTARSARQVGRKRCQFSGGAKFWRSSRRSWRQTRQCTRTRRPDAILDEERISSASEQNVPHFGQSPPTYSL